LDNKEKNKQNAVSFENLKKLSGLISGSELSSLANYISKSKMALDTFCAASDKSKPLSTTFIGVLLD
jgi:hypothetical protein